jgi:glyoxylase-like metal-dependent hydrolase (beta-lactamase superfamily II)
MADLAKLGVSALAPGVWRAALPFPSPLVYSVCYVLHADAGLIALDLGWDSDESWTLFQAALTLAGGSLADLVGVVVTHTHPDHYGIAHRVRANSSAWIAVHPAERPQLAPTEQDRQRRVDDMAGWLRACDAPPSELERLKDEEFEIASHVPTTLPDFDLVDGQAVPGTAGRLVTVHTPGHTPGHLCFEDREYDLLFAGDHVLPRVTANVSKRPTSGDDPLRDYESSVTRLRDSSARLILPGHEWSFDRLDERLTAIQQHHAARLEEVHSAVRSRQQTVWEVAQAVSWSRPFASLDGRATRSAVGETLAHLHRLTSLGSLVMTGDEPYRWTSVT